MRGWRRGSPPKSCGGIARPASHAVDWDVAEMLELSVAPGDEARGVCVPVVPLVCPNCGYVTLFSAKRIGLCDDG